MSSRRKSAPAILTTKHVRWLGALLLAVQLPQAYYMPAWIALVGCGLVLSRMWLQGRPVVERERVLARIPAYVLGLFSLGTGVGVRLT